jgi:Tfp pilus assembly PilM family ATPase
MKTFRGKWGRMTAVDRAPESSSHTTVGVDVGAVAIKVVEIAHDRDGPEVIRLGLRHVLAQGEGLIVELLQDLWDKERFGRRDVVCAVRQAHLPNRAELKERADREGQLSRSDAERVDAVLELLRRADLRAAIMDLPALAVTNALVWNHPEAGEGTVAVIDLGGTSTTLLLLEEGIPTFTTTTRIPAEVEPPPVGPSLAQRRRHALARVLDVEAAIEAWRALESAGAGVGEPPRVGQAFLIGGGTRVPGLAEALSDRLEVALRWAQPFERLPVAPLASSPGGLDDEHPMFLQAVGLALRRL